MLWMSLQRSLRRREQTPGGGGTGTGALVRSLDRSARSWGQDRDPGEDDRTHQFMCPVCAKVSSLGRGDYRSTSVTFIGWWFDVREEICSSWTSCVRRVRREAKVWDQEEEQTHFPWGLVYGRPVRAALRRRDGRLPRQEEGLDLVDLETRGDKDGLAPGLHYAAARVETRDSGWGRGAAEIGNVPPRVQTQRALNGPLPPYDFQKGGGRDLPVFLITARGPSIRLSAGEDTQIRGLAEEEGDGAGRRSVSSQQRQADRGRRGQPPPSGAVASGTERRVESRVSLRDHVMSELTFDSVRTYTV